MLHLEYEVSYTNFKFDFFSFKWVFEPQFIIVTVIIITIIIVTITDIIIINIFITTITVVIIIIIVSAKMLLSLLCGAHLLRIQCQGRQAASTGA